LPIYSSQNPNQSVYITRFSIQCEQIFSLLLPYGNFRYRSHEIWSRKKIANDTIEEFPRTQNARCLSSRHRTNNFHPLPLFSLSTAISAVS
jgi:hypothetical protein